MKDGGAMKKIISILFAVIMLVCLAPVGFIIGCIWFGIRCGLEVCNAFLEWIDAPTLWEEK